jgi:hypothetical protein
MIYEQWKGQQTLADGKFRNCDIKILKFTEKKYFIVVEICMKVTLLNKHKGE